MVDSALAESVLSGLRRGVIRQDVHIDSEVGKMSGHSKWSTIKRKKGAIDAARGKVFTKLAREITLSAKLGGGDLESNARLRQAVLDAKEENMPKDNIERAIKKGTGGLDAGAAYEEITYEGYGPGGVAVIVEVVTDNKNRTVAEVRHVLSKYGGNLGENGCVSWIFQKKGSILIDKTAAREEALMELALEAGAEDVREDDTAWEVVTEPLDYEAVKKKVDERQLKYIKAGITMIPASQVKLESPKAEQMLRMMAKLEDLDDVQKVYANFDIPDEVMEKIAV